MTHSLKDPHQNEICYLGADLDKGRLPALIYFSLSAKESLQVYPYNTPAAILSDFPLRIFSFTMPGHGQEFDKFQAIAHWAEKMAAGEAILENFFNETLFGIDWLVQQGVIDTDHFGVAGLSRGAFVATHIASLEKRIQHVLGFAPVTKLTLLKEFVGKEELLSRAEKWDLLHRVSELTHLRNLRFYIGNHDDIVSTDACYEFIKGLAQTVYEKKARSMAVELRITPSIGYKGHGTSPQTFEEGASWMKHQLLGS